MNSNKKSVFLLCEKNINNCVSFKYMNKTVTVTLGNKNKNYTWISHTHMKSILLVSYLQTKPQTIHNRFLHFIEDFIIKLEIQDKYKFIRIFFDILKYLHKILLSYYYIHKTILSIQKKDLFITNRYICF